MKKQILLATTNKGKLEDVKEILKDLDVEILSFLDFDDYPSVEETGLTFLANAELKVKAAYEKYRLPCLGDDSGLESFQLNGELKIVFILFCSLLVGEMFAINKFESF